MVMLRSISRAVASIARKQFLRHRQTGTRGLVTQSVPSLVAPASSRLPSECSSPLAMEIGRMRLFSEYSSQMPTLKDPEVHNAFKGLMAANWDELPNPAMYDVKEALSKDTDDKAGQEVLANVLRAAEAVEEFSGILTSLKMELDDSIGAFGEDVKPLSDELSNAVSTAYARYMSYLDAFGPEEGYLRKKVETELGAKMIHLKMRCGKLGSEWGKVTVLGTSGLAGSYVEQRAKQ